MALLIAGAARLQENQAEAGRRRQREAVEEARAIAERRRTDSVELVVRVAADSANRLTPPLALDSTIHASGIAIEHPVVHDRVVRFVLDSAERTVRIVKRDRPKLVLAERLLASVTPVRQVDVDRLARLKTASAAASRQFAVDSARSEQRRARRAASLPPSGATARCRDGTYSFSRSRRGACSHHGGVAMWL
ncbi:MAG: DUF3761 domain-containing protein [Gemmatimonadales bacterium]|nr:DUF3761 domain-containing protein [Gemmatimonadales bacterium]